MWSGHRFAVDRIGALLGDLLDFIYPPFCALCGCRLSAGERSVCRDCWRSLAVIEAPYCRRCGLPLNSAGSPCPACRSRRRMFSFARSFGPFDERLQQIVHLLKYRHRKSLAEPLARLLASVIERDRRFDNMEAVVPVPLHSVKARTRGYNQSELIASYLAREVGLRLLKKSLRRTRNTPSQSGLGSAQREINVRGAFAVRNPETISGKRLILVDDVLTTGATVDACVQALLQADANEVCVLTVARTPEPGISP